LKVENQFWVFDFIHIPRHSWRHSDDGQLAKERQLFIHQDFFSFISFFFTNFFFYLLVKVVYFIGVFLEDVDN
jgi:hypothetical protein